MLQYQEKFNIFNNDGSIIHLDIAEKISTQIGGKNLTKRNTGKFYTPEIISEPLIKKVIESSDLNSRKDAVSIIDPFCGDGRLIRLLLEQIKNKYLQISIHLWEYDQYSLSIACSEIKKASAKFKDEVKIFPKKVDSFAEFFNHHEGQYDVVITNPPWEVVKPDPKEISALPSEDQKHSYVNSLKAFSNKLMHDYPLSKPEKTYGGWGVNLARVGTELSFRLLKDGGVIGLVSPSTIFADQNSHAMRRWLFQNNNLSNIQIFPAELKVFKGVDQPSVFVIATHNNKQRDLKIRHHLGNGGTKDLVIHNLHTLLQSTDYVLPVSIPASPTQLKILSSFTKLPRFSDLENDERVWMGRELDETNHKEWVSLNGRYRFIKGKNIDRFHLNKESLVYVNESLKRKLPHSIVHHRLVWRDVSRPNQKRRVIATMVPPGYVAGNSLGVLYARRSNNESTLFWLLGLLSSYIFEFQLRAHLATAHVSAGVIRKMRIPFVDPRFERELSGLVRERLNGDQDVENRIEVLTARAYGINRNDFAEVLNVFPKVSYQERTALLGSRYW